MNYLVEIKAFYDLVQIKQLSTGQIALWHALMAINNKCAWIEWFTVPNLTLELNTGMSRSGILKARNILKQYDLIDFKQNGTKATIYKLKTIANSKQVGVQDSKQVSKQVGVQDSKQVSNTLNKLNETKQNEIYNVAVANITKCYEENIGMITPAIAELLFSYLNNFSDYEIIIEAIKKSALANKRNTSYINGILKSWKNKGYKVLADLQNEQAQEKDKITQETEEERLARKTRELEEALKNDKW